MFTNCKSCDHDCLDFVSDACVAYTGPDIPVVNIESDTVLSENVVNLANKLVEHIENSVVDLSCLYDEIDEQQVTALPEATQQIINRLCNLNTDQITTPAPLYCLADGVSHCSAQISERGMQFGMTPTSGGMTFTYDITPATDNLPQNFQVANTKVRALGTTKQGGGVVADLSARRGGFQIKNKEFPVNVNVRCTVSTPCGQVELTKRVGLTNPSQSGSFGSSMEVKDLGGSADFVHNQTGYNQTLAAAICNLKTRVDSLDVIEISDCDYFSYPGQEIDAIIQAHGAHLCDAINRIEHIGAEPVGYISYDSECGEEHEEVSLQQALTNMQKDINESKRQIKQLQDENQYLRSLIENCTDCSADSSNSTTGGEGGTNPQPLRGDNNCPDGNCF